MIINGHSLIGLIQCQFVDDITSVATHEFFAGPAGLGWQHRFRKASGEGFAKS